MSSDNKAFNEVRAILGKLDRSIDEARNKRVGPSDLPVGRPIDASENRPAGRSGLDREIGVSRATTPATPMQAKRAQYGRARPLTREGEPARGAPSENGWKSPKDYDDMPIG